MNPFLSFVENIEAEVRRAATLSVSGRAVPVESGARVLLFSPHPDDECITGLLPLRLMREAGKEIINIPVTYGSSADRRPGRAAELAAACDYLGWKVDHGAEGHDSLGVDDVVRVLERYRPEIIFMPHQADWNSRHISTHFLVVDALKNMPAGFRCAVVETEFWGAMDDPNLMVEGDAATVADLVAATSLHVEEVRRNPYHLRLPAWMQDNVRRGGELVGGQGGKAPAFPFATLYRLREWRNGALVDGLEGGTMVPMGAGNLKEVF
jgi:LmbE family N-acetylglucosaminyl deacetylase